MCVYATGLYGQIRFRDVKERRGLSRSGDADEKEMTRDTDARSVGGVAAQRASCSCTSTDYEVDMY